MELVTIIVLADELAKVRPQLSYIEYKEVVVKDNFFDGDEAHKLLKDKSIKAYKALKEYEFEKRHNKVINNNTTNQ